MKKIFLLLSLLTLPVFGFQTSARIDLSSTNINTHFGGPNGLVPFPLNFSSFIQTVQVDNTRNANEIVINCNTLTIIVPDDSSGFNFYVAPGLTWSFPPITPFGKTCYIRSLSGTLSSGIVIISATGN